MKQERKNTIIQNQQPKNDNVNTNNINNNHTFLIVPGFLGKTRLILKILSRKPN